MPNTDGESQRRIQGSGGDQLVQRLSLLKAVVGRVPRADKGEQRFTKNSRPDHT